MCAIRHHPVALQGLHDPKGPRRKDAPAQTFPQKIVEAARTHLPSCSSRGGVKPPRGKPLAKMADATPWTWTSCLVPTTGKQAIPHAGAHAAAHWLLIGSPLKYVEGMHPAHLAHHASTLVCYVERHPKPVSWRPGAGRARRLPPSTLSARRRHHVRRRRDVGGAAFFCCHHGAHRPQRARATAMLEVHADANCGDSNLYASVLKMHDWRGGCIPHTVKNI